MKAHIDIPKEAVAAFCHRWQIKDLALFGSALRDDFTTSYSGVRRGGL